MSKPTMIAFERRYFDDSGVEFGVTLAEGEIALRSNGSQAEFPAEEIDWLIDCLQYIKREAILTTKQVDG